jgi:hypothetical protein
MLRTNFLRWGVSENVSEIGFPVDLYRMQPSYSEQTRTEMELSVDSSAIFNKNSFIIFRNASTLSSVHALSEKNS